MAKNKGQRESFITNWTEGQKYVIDDIEHQSKALVPIQIDIGNSVEIVQVDGGLITGLPKGEVICDNLVYTIKDSNMGLNITWIIELKGTKNPKEAKHSIKQIISSIQYFQDQVEYPKAFKYVNNRDYVFAAIAGAPDKTLPVLNNGDIKALCQKLMAISIKRKSVKDMFMLFCYIRPNIQCKKVEVRGDKPPYNIYCYKNQGGYIPYPSMLMKLLEDK